MSLKLRAFDYLTKRWRWIEAPTAGSAIYRGPSTAVANLSGEDLPLGDSHEGDDLIDVTNPLVPFAISEGVYAITSVVTPSEAMTEGGIYSLSMDFDSEGEDQSVSQTLEATSAIPQPSALLPFTYYIPEGGVLRFQAVNLDGVKTLSFGLTVYVQKLV